MYTRGKLSYRLNYASGYRSPSLKELYMNWDHLGMFMIMGNEELRPETNRYYSGSLEYSGNRIHGSLNAYMNYFTDKIEGQWEEDQTIYRYQNISSSNLKGLEALLQVRILSNLDVKGGWSYVDDSHRQEGIRLSSVSPHTANLQLEYRFIRPGYKAVANLSGRYTGAKNYLVREEIEYRGELQEAWYPVHYDGYALWRMSVSQTFRRGINLILGVENLFNYTAARITFNTPVSPGRHSFIMLRLSVDEIYNSMHKP
jgi:outer membrane receptor for ferrienterochelin and colicins